jgi:heme exporter protein D
MGRMAAYVWLALLIGLIGTGVVRVIVMSGRLRRAARAAKDAAEEAEQAERLRALRTVVAADYARAAARRWHNVH